MVENALVATAFVLQALIAATCVIDCVIDCVINYHCSRDIPCKPIWRLRTKLWMLSN